MADPNMMDAGTPAATGGDTAPPEQTGGATESFLIEKTPDGKITCTYTGADGKPEVTDAGSMEEALGTAKEKMESPDEGINTFGMPRGMAGKGMM